MNHRRTIVLGAGMTGLAVGWASGLQICEAEHPPGGICSSYYIRPRDTQTLHDPGHDDEAYRFEVGGGHWIFGGDPAVLRLIRTLTPVMAYERWSAVFFPEHNISVSYPLQNHLAYLGKEIASQALSEMLTAPEGRPHTMAEWLEQIFGPTLTKLFFGPFHQRYTAGLWKHIAPQDAYKSPVNPKLAIQGAFDRTPPTEYNIAFLYPQEGLNVLAQRLSASCDVQYGRRAVDVDVQAKEVLFTDGSCLPYDMLISTLPLNTMMAISGLAVDEPPDPYTSVLVLNIGATRGPECPDDHWLYIPPSEAGFHRVGFYSNVDVSFLPRGSRESRDRVSIYVERAYPGGQKPSDADVAVYAKMVAQELKQWGWIDRIEVQDPTWIDVAYTWSMSRSRWREKALKLLEAHDIVQVGRYGRWVFQGIADSLSEGLMVGAALGKRG